jgi:hypothetical protein
LFDSYKEQKNHEKDLNKDFRPSLMWSRMINSNYSELINSYEKNDFSKFVNFLDRFGHSKKYLGITFNILISKYFGFLKKTYIKKNMLDNSFKKWSFFTNNKDYKSLSTPRFGNLDGGYINDDIFVSYTSFFNEIYSSVLKNLISDKPNPVIGEIGPGYGEQAYFILKDKTANYIAFDLPETLTLSSFYLMNTFKSKKTLLYGERDFSNEVIKDNIDLMVNKHSLGEMPPNTVKNYVDKIKKTSKLVFHINQSYYKRVFDKNSYNLLSHEYGFDNDSNFELIIKYLDFCHFNYDNFQNFNMDLFFHIYKKKAK